MSEGRLDIPLYTVTIFKPLSLLFEIDWAPSSNYNQHDRATLRFTKLAFLVHGLFSVSGMTSLALEIQKEPAITLKWVVCATDYLDLQIL